MHFSAYHNYSGTGCVPVIDSLVLERAPEKGKGAAKLAKISSHVELMPFHLSGTPVDNLILAVSAGTGAVPNKSLSTGKDKRKQL